MNDTVENLILDLLEWVGRKERTYWETMGEWRTSCQRLPVWEDANDRGLVERTSIDGRPVIRVTRVSPFSRKRGRMLINPCQQFADILYVVSGCRVRWHR
jgi:hypothetical protein